MDYYQPKKPLPGNQCNRHDTSSSSPRSAVPSVSGPLLFTALPIDLHVQLIPYLDFRSLQMLRATNSYFRNLPSDSDIARARQAYKLVLLNREREQVNHDYESKEEDASNSGLLTCYTCFRTLPISVFSSTQTTRRRTRGHADAHKRFCSDCAIRGEKWVPGSVSSFPRRGKLIYCRRCRSIGPLPESRRLVMAGLCEDCRVRMDLPEAVERDDAYVSDRAWSDTLSALSRFFVEHNNIWKPIPEFEWARLDAELAVAMKQTERERLALLT